jgi:hypothetical protein
VTALLAVLAVGWATDFRTCNGRADATPWAPIANRWPADCQRTPQGSLRVDSLQAGSVLIRCSNLRR